MKRFSFRAACIAAALLAGPARADDKERWSDDADSAQMKSDFRHLGHTIGEAAKSVAKDAVHLTHTAVHKADRKLNGSDSDSKASKFDGK